MIIEVIEIHTDIMRFKNHIEIIIEIIIEIVIETVIKITFETIDDMIKEAIIMRAM